MVVIVGCAAGLLYLFLERFADFIDLVTITGFLAAPIVAYANQLVVTGSNVPAELKPGAALLRWNAIAVAALTAATLGFFYLRWL